MEMVIARFKKMMNISMIMELLDVIVGLILFFCTSFVVKVNAVILGSLLLVHGLFSLIRYFYDGLGNRFFAIDLILSVVGIILGLFTIIYSFESVSLLGIMFGVWVICEGLEKGYYGFLLKKVEDSSYPIVWMLSVMVILMGALVLFNPFNAIILLTKLIGLFLICESILEMVSFSIFKKRSKVMLEMFK